MQTPGSSPQTERKPTIARGGWQEETLLTPAPLAAKAPIVDEFSRFDRPRLFTRGIALTTDVLILGISAFALGGAYGDLLAKLLPHWGTVLIIFSLILFVYSVLFEASSLRGTPGKRLLGYVVVDAKGQRLSFSRVIVRNLLRPVSFISGGFIMQLFSPDGQMFHDKIVGAIAEGLPPER